MAVSEILKLAIDRAAAVNVYWNLLIAVSTAVLGIMASGKSFTSSRNLKMLLTCAFALFAYSNLAAIIRLGELRSALLSMLSAEMEVRSALIAGLQPAPLLTYAAFHITLDAAVVAALWLVPWRAQEQHSESVDSNSHREGD